MQNFPGTPKGIMSINYIQKTAASLLALINDSEKICLPIFASKLERAVEAYPEDKTLGVMSGIIEKMADNKLTISRKELKDLYSRLYSRNTKFASIFKEELGLEEVQETTRKASISDTSITAEDMAPNTDPVLANALAGVFGGVSHPYSKLHAQRALSVCANAFSIAGLTPDVSIDNGTDEVIICRASFQTPKGTTSVLVPVEFIDNKALHPEAFVANTGVENFNRAELQTYLTTKAGQKLTVSANTILDVVREQKAKKVSDVDLAITKLNATREKQADNMDGNILGQKMNTATTQDVETVKYNDKEIESFAKQFDSSFGVASFKFGESKVKIARELINRKMQVLGLSNYQISVFDSTENSILYAVSMNNGKVAFRVPVKVEDGHVLSPSVLIANGSITSFSEDAINQLMVGDKTDYRAAAVASPFSSFSAQKLVELVKNASNDGLYAKAEEALNILEEMGNKEAYTEAFESYTAGLNGVKTVASQCSMIVKSANSQHAMCGHLNLPLHKVITKAGFCTPAYRQNMAETYDAAYLQDHKIHF